MATYDYRCRTCDAAFEVRRSVTDAPAASVGCPSGHAETSRVWSAVAVTGVAAGATARSTAPASGGCCGGGCCG